MTMASIIECLRCNLRGVQTVYKGNSAVKCPDCDNLLFVEGIR